MGLKYALESSDACLAVGRGVISLLVTRDLEAAKKVMYDAARHREPAEWATNEPLLFRALEQIARMFEK